MKKRLLSLALSALLVLGCLSPLAVPATGSAPAYPEIGEEAYNALYVQDGLIDAYDFFRLNEFWSDTWADGEAPTLPPAPGLDSQYDDNRLDSTAPFIIVRYAKSSPNTINSSWGLDANGNKAWYDGSSGLAYSESATGTKKIFTFTDEATARDVLTGIEGKNEIAYTYAVIRQPKVSSTYKTARTNYATTVENDLKLFAHRGTVGMQVYLPEISPISYHDQTGLKQGANVYYVSADAEGTERGGYLQMTNAFSSQSYLQFTGLPTAGTIVGEYVMTGGPATTSSGADKKCNFLTLSEVVLYKEGDALTRFDGYNGVKFTGKGDNEGCTISSSRLYLKTKAITLADPNAVNVYGIHVKRDGGDLTAGLWFNGKEIISPATATDSSTTGIRSQLGFSSTTEARVYAVRFYEQELDANGYAQNHFADLCKYFRLDITRMSALHASDIAYLAVRMADFSFTDDRDAVASALDSHLDYLLEDSLTGSGASLEIFLTAVRNGDVDASAVRALPSAYQAEVITAYADLLEKTPEADTAERQNAVDNAVATVLSREFGDYYNKTPLLLAEDFFAEKTLSAAAAHFFEVAKANNMDMKPLEDVDDTILEYLYLDFADVIPSLPSLTAVLQKRMIDALVLYRELYYGVSVVEGLLSFYGYQLTMHGDTGVRAVYTVNPDVLADLESHGFTVHFGAIFTTESEEPTVKREGNAYVPATSDVKQEAVYKTGVGYSGNHFTLGGKTAFAYEHMSENVQESLRFVAYAVLERTGQEPSIHYFTPKGETIKTASVTLNTLARACRDTVGTVYPNVQKILVRRGATEASPSVYLGSLNLTEQRPVMDNEHRTMVKSFQASIRAYTQAPSAMPEISIADATGTKLIRFETGDAVSFKQADDGSLVFTYVKDKEDAAIALLEAELERTKENLYATGTPALPTAFLVLGEIKEPKK